jgi:hypothetical protein
MLEKKIEQTRNCQICTKNLLSIRLNLKATKFYFIKLATHSIDNESIKGATTLNVIRSVAKKPLMMNFVMQCRGALFNG